MKKELAIMLWKLICGSIPAKEVAEFLWSTNTATIVTDKRMTKSIGFARKRYKPIDFNPHSYSMNK